MPYPEAVRSPIVFVLILGLLVAAPGFAALDRVLLISVDTLRPDYLGCYGGTKAATPHIDSIAARGVRFVEAAAPTPLTLPSHASLLTALDPPRHGHRDNSGFVLPAAATTLAEVLAGKGWQTGAFVAALFVVAAAGHAADDPAWSKWLHMLSGTAGLALVVMLAPRQTPPRR